MRRQTCKHACDGRRRRWHALEMRCSYIFQVRDTHVFQRLHVWTFHKRDQCRGSWARSPAGRRQNGSPVLSRLETTLRRRPARCPRTPASPVCVCVVCMCACKCAFLVIFSCVCVCTCVCDKYTCPSSASSPDTDDDDTAAATCPPDPALCPARSFSAAADRDAPAASTSMSTRSSNMFISEAFAFVGEAHTR